MLNDRILTALNRQIQRELHASYLYLAMAAYFEDQTLAGFAAWMRKQSDEERSHAMRIFDYVYDRGGKVTLEALDRPDGDYSSPYDAMEKALSHERRVTVAINDLYELAVEDKDHATAVMLHWFIDEQVEEEKTAGDIVDKLNRIQNNPAGLLMLDRELAARGGG